MCAYSAMQSLTFSFKYVFCQVNVNKKVFSMTSFILGPAKFISKQWSGVQIYFLSFLSWTSSGNGQASLAFSPAEKIHESAIISRLTKFAAHTVVGYMMYNMSFDLNSKVINCTSIGQSPLRDYEMLSLSPFLRQIFVWNLFLMEIISVTFKMFITVIT